MQIETFNPQNKELKKHIESFHILEHSQNEDEISYLTFPSNHSIVRHMQSSIEKTKMTELSYIIDFFDQSHMITTFKSLTGYTPKIFFKNLVTIDQGKIHWIFN
jgi:AraC-like DNA-binding protein